MELIVKYNNIPIKAIPEESLNKILIVDFSPWLADLLSLTDEISSNRLEIALPAIKEHAWSMGFDEIKKMFEMYADNKLSITPIPNYFDRILLGKIVEAYKSQKQKTPKEINTLKDMEETNKLHLFKFFKQYFLLETINDCYVHLAYKFLEDKGFIKLSKEEKIKLMDDAKTFITIEKNSEMSLRNKLHEFQAFEIANDEQVFVAKKMAIKSCLRKLEKSDIERIEKLIKYEK